MKKPLLAPIREMRIDGASSVRFKSVQVIIEHYREARFFDRYFPAINTILTKEYQRLADLNVDLLRFAFNELGIDTRILIASELGIPGGEKSTTLFNVCKAAGATTYVSGISGREYLNLRLFEDAGITVEFQEFFHPVYRQLYEPFIPCMSVLDLLFNCGPSSKDVLRGIGVARLEKVFL